MLFQEPALFPWLSVAGNVELALKLIDVPADRATIAPTPWLTNVGLERFADVQPHELSAGMRRAALARASPREPDVLLGDEPFGALDAQARELLQDEVQRVWVERDGRDLRVRDPQRAGSRAPRRPGARAVGRPRAS